MLKYKNKEGININIRKTIFVILTALLICIGAWLLQDASEPDTGLKQEGSSQNDDTVVEKNDILQQYDAQQEHQIQDAPHNEEFELKNEEEYVQLRLSVTSAEGKRENVEKYLKENLDVSVVEDYSGNTVLSSDKDDYDLALSTIIDCPYTENVLYKNEDYYPVACEIYDKSLNDGKIPEEAAEYIENIEKMCKNVIIVVN